MFTSAYSFKKLKGVGNVELVLNKNQHVYTFIGTNGIGKTKTLEALFQLYFYGGTKQNQGGNAHAIVFKFAKNENLTVEEHIDSSATVIVNEKSLVTQALPLVFIGAGLRGQLNESSGFNEAIGTFEQRREKYIYNLIRQMGVDLSILGNEPNGLDAWFVKRAQSANPYQKAKDNRAIEITTLLKVLHDIDDRFDLDPIELSGDNKVELSINGIRRRLSELSSGFVSLLKMIQAIIAGYSNITNDINLTHVKGVVFIDEIESHLHSEWQTKIIPTLKKSFPNTTFFITTHSPLVLTQLNEGEAYQLARDEDGVVRSHLIKQPNNKLLADLLMDAFRVDLNELKAQQLENDDQVDVKNMMLKLLGEGDEK